MTFSLPKIDASLLYTGETEFEEFVISLLKLKDDVGESRVSAYLKESVNLTINLI
jgi:hypothetical protein